MSPFSYLLSQQKFSPVSGGFFTSNIISNNSTLFRRVFLEMHKTVIYSYFANFNNGIWNRVLLRIGRFMFFNIKNEKSL